MTAHALALTSSGAADLNQPGSYLHWSIFDISVANLVVIAVMVVIFAAALLLPFPRPRQLEPPAPRPRAPASRAWARRPTPGCGRAGPGGGRFACCRR